MAITTATGQTYSEQDIKNWFSAAPRTDADIAKISADQAKEARIQEYARTNQEAQNVFTASQNTLTREQQAAQHAEKQNHGHRSSEL